VSDKAVLVRVTARQRPRTKATYSPNTRTSTYFDVLWTVRCPEINVLMNPVGSYTNLVGHTAACASMCQLSIHIAMLLVHVRAGWGLLLLEAAATALFQHWWRTTRWQYTGVNTTSAAPWAWRECTVAAGRWLRTCASFCSAAIAIKECRSTDQQDVALPRWTPVALSFCHVH
jgi:hypothetical protein